MQEAKLRGLTSDELDQLAINTIRTLSIDAAIDEAVPANVLTAALFERFSSRGEADFQNKLLSALRFQFGGHVEKSAEK